MGFFDKREKDNILADELIETVGTGNPLVDTITFGGAALVHKMLPSVDYNCIINDTRNIEDCITKMYSLLSDIGVIRSTSSGEIPYILVTINSGFGNMNPALVCVVFRFVDENNTEIHINASAKEGLIKQHTAEKAVNRIQELYS